MSLPNKILKVTLGCHQFFNKDGSRKPAPKWFEIGQMFVPKKNECHNQPMLIVHRQNADDLLLTVFDDRITLVTKEGVENVFYIS